MAEISDAVTVNRAVEFIWKGNPDLVWRFGVSGRRGGAISMPGALDHPSAGHGVVLDLGWFGCLSRKSITRVRNRSGSSSQG